MCVTDGCAHVVHVEYYFYFFNLIPSKILIITITVVIGRYLMDHFLQYAFVSVVELNNQYYLHCHLLPQCCNEGSNSISFFFFIYFLIANLMTRLSHSSTTYRNTGKLIFMMCFTLLQWERRFYDTTSSSFYYSKFVSYINYSNKSLLLIYFVV